MVAAAQRWRAAYAATTYRARYRGRRVAVRLGQRGPGWVGQGAFVTGWNPRSVVQGRPANHRAQARLRAVLRGQGLRLAEGFGQPDDDHPGEPMLLAFPLRPALAARIGRAFRQNAVLLVAPRRPARLLWLR
ncbi:hypothetical protein BKE38_29330 [Pseudoroseomonas deserti]|uniref:DUF3293 domain-containing protein n=1 Tax=Teichococcus deserti TaxID=1817963 RepID=A0A1V2GU39_9PROT|nr:DUF3293 domain-containing protein [Pseudoroseomonas deserti]ONG42478.1 hypothetical protein BKE38_29330 [Pseudoroseomonas deserti]